MNVPNILTLFRLFLVPMFVLTFFSNIKGSLYYSIFIFLIAGFTDVLDGYIARRYNLITRWGTLFDPFADKLMLITVLSCLAIQNYIPIWMLIVMAIKEIFMIAGSAALLGSNIIIPANIAGKMSTFLFYLSIISMGFNRRIGTYLIYFAVGSAIFALLNYLTLYVKNYNLHKQQ